MAYQVTIGIPVYNVEKHIRMTMDSALAQTFPDIEFLVLDDCGSDHSIEIIQEYQQTHPRGKDIRIIHQPHNMGIGEARNRMMDEAQGRYFYSLDAGDKIFPNTIELLYAAAQEHNAEIVYGSHERLFIDGENVSKVNFVYPHRVFTEPDEYACYCYTVGVQVMNWNFLLLLDIIRQNHLRLAPVGHGYGEDFTFTVDLPTYITRAVLLPDITYQYYTEKKDHKQKRKKQMSRTSMDAAIAAIDQKKQRTYLSGRPYYALRVAKLMMYDYGFVRQIVLRRNEAQPRYTDRELRDTMRHPMTFMQIICSRQAVLKNLFYGFFGILPPLFCVLLLKFFLFFTGLVVYVRKIKKRRLRNKNVVK